MGVGLEGGDQLARGLEVLTAFEFGDELFEIGQRFRSELHLDQRIAEIEIGAVAATELGILLEQRLEAIDRAGIPLRAPVKETDLIVGLAQSILRLAEFALDLVDVDRPRGSGRIAIEERLEGLDGFARLGLIALRRAHLLEVGHADLVLRVIGALVRRIEAQKLRVLVQREDERFRRAFAEVRVGEPELRVGAIGAAGVRFDDLLEELARGEPLLVVQLRHAAVVQKLVRLRRSRRDGVAGVGRTCACSDGGRHGENQKSGEVEPPRSHMHQRVPANQSYSAASPCSRPTRGSKPRSARASDVSAYVCRMSPFCAGSTVMRGVRPVTRAMISKT